MVPGGGGVLTTQSADVTGARTARGGTHHGPFGVKRKGAGRFALAADRPAACLQGLEQHACLGGADGKLRDADREAG